MRIVADDPITSSSQDAYGRQAVVARCADALLAASDKTGFVIGLSGPWGSGKTSMINMVKERLAGSEHPPKVVSFNPWLYSTQEQLLREFFAELGRAIDKKNHEELATAISQYAEALAPGLATAISLAVPESANAAAAVPVLAALGSQLSLRRLKRIARTLGASGKTVEELRKELIVQLSKLDENIVVIIDDVDRLSREEIRLLFKLVNLTASFPRLTYLLSFDSAVVEHALAGVQGASGRLYLDKIVQLPLEVPELSKQTIQHTLGDMLASYLDMIDAYNAVGDESPRLIRCFELFVVHRVGTPRRIKRYGNKFAEFNERVGEEICPTDALSMVGIMLFFPHLHRWIWDNRYELCSETVRFASSGDADVPTLVRSLHGALSLDGIRQEESKAVAQALTWLFPALRLGDSSSAQGRPVGIARETGRVANLANLELCYEALSGDTVSRRELYRLVEQADAGDFRDGVAALNDQGELGRLLDIVESARANLGDRRCVFLAEQLLTVSRHIHLERRPNRLELSVSERLAEVLGELMVGIGIGRADAVMRNALARFELLDYCRLTYFLRDERLAQLGEGTRGPCLSSQIYTQVASNYADEVTSCWREVLRLPDVPPAFFWCAIDRDSDQGRLADVAARFGNDGEMQVLCAAKALHEWWPMQPVSSTYGGVSYGRADSEALLGVPEPATITSYAATEQFRTLPESMQLRVAALYQLLERAATQDGSARQRISQDEAREQVRLWRESYVAPFDEVLPVTHVG